MLSFYYFKRDKISYSLGCILIGGLLLRLGVSLDPFLHAWDERYHALVAKNILKHPLSPTLYDNPVLSYDFKNWPSNHIWLHKQPLPLWAIALSLKIFGISAFAVRIPSLILSTMAIWLTFKISKNLFQSNRIALMAAFFHSINGLIVEITGGRVATDHIDLFFFFFVELAVFFATTYLKKKTLLQCCLIGGCIGLAMLCKWLTALVVLPVWVVLAIPQVKRKQVLLNAAVILSTAFVIFLPWQVYILLKFPQEAIWELSSYSRHLTEVIEDRTGGYFYFIGKTMVVFNELILLVLAWHLYWLFRRRYEAARFSLLLWFFIPLIFFSFAKTKMEAYLLFTGPALFILTACFVDELLNLRFQHKAYRWATGLLVFLVFAFPIRYTLERIKPFEAFDSTDLEPVCRIEQLKKRGLPSNTLVFNDPHCIETMFYTPYTSYEKKPDKLDSVFVKERGYLIYVMPDQGN